MENYQEILATEFNFDNITIYKKLNGGVHYAWKIVTDDGYVMYDTTADDKDYDEEGNASSITYYFTVAHCPLSYNFEEFPWVAVPRETISEDLIY